MFDLLVLSLIAGAALADHTQCNIGPLYYSGFDFPKFEGPWIWLYHTDNVHERPFGCIKDDFKHGTDLSKSLLLAYNLQTNTNDKYDSFARDWNDNSYYHDFTDPSVVWRGRYYIMGIVYDSFVVLKGCIKGEHNPYVWIGFRTATPSDKEISNANKTLNAYDMSIEKLLKYPDCQLS